jgi:hypothetical protein
MSGFLMLYSKYLVWVMDAIFKWINTVPYLVLVAIATFPIFMHTGKAMHVSGKSRDISDCHWISLESVRACGQAGQTQLHTLPSLSANTEASHVLKQPWTNQSCGHEGIPGRRTLQITHSRFCACGKILWDGCWEQAREACVYQVRLRLGEKNRC